MRLLTLPKKQKKLQQKKQNKATLELGQQGEELARAYLLKNGYKIIESNKSSKIAEIDIIALDADTLVFVEVKTRTSTKYGLPEEAVNMKKQEKIRKLGLFYAQENPHLPQKLRIDIVSILTDFSGHFTIKLLKGD